MFGPNSKNGRHATHRCRHITHTARAHTCASHTSVAASSLLETVSGSPWRLCPVAMRTLSIGVAHARGKHAPTRTGCTEPSIFEQISRSSRSFSIFVADLCDVLDVVAAAVSPGGAVTRTVARALVVAVVPPSSSSSSSSFSLRFALLVSVLASSAASFSSSLSSKSMPMTLSLQSSSMNLFSTMAMPSALQGLAASVTCTSQGYVTLCDRADRRRRTRKIRFCIFGAELCTPTIKSMATMIASRMSTGQLPAVFLR
jgi:hypothetical protein